MIFGINAVFYYSNLIWESVGFSQDQAFMTSMITNGINVATTLVAIALIDRIGRKRVIWGSILGTAPFSLALPYANLHWTLILVFCAGVMIASGVRPISSSG